MGVEPQNQPGLRTQSRASAAAERLRRGKERILGVWESRARERLAAARHESRLTLRDSLPDFLSDLEEALRTSVRNVRADLVRVAKKHGSERARSSDYTIEEALAEYNILRKVIFEVLEEEGVLEPRERDIIYEAINFGLAKAGAEYAKLQTEKENAAKLEAQHERALLAESQLQLRLTLSASKVGLFDLDLSSGMIEWSEEEATLFGYEPSVRHVPYARAEERVHPDDRAALRAAIDLAVAQNGEYHTEFRLCLPDGKTRWVRGLGKVSLGVDGKPARLRGANLDITEVREADEKVRRKEAKYRTLAELSPLIIFAADRNGNDTYVNRTFEEYLGIRLEDAGGEAWLTLVHPDDHERTRKRWRHSIETGEFYENEYRLKRARDGDYRWMRVRARPVRGADGRIEQWIGVSIDIHEQRQADEERTRLIESLQREKSIREQFVNTLTHDLRTPLAAIKMSAQIANRRSEDATVQMMTARIIENVNRGDRMIEDLLDANRIKAGQGIVPEVQSIDLAQVARTAVEDLTTIHGDRFVLQCPRQVPAWLCPFGLRRVVENLCTNAVKYGDEHRPITVRIEPEGDQVKLAVHNFGRPVSAEDQKRLFQDFHRTREAVDSGSQGWGLGLTIVKGVAEAHCGEVDLRSEPDFGTEFWIRVPLDARPCVSR